MKCERCGNLNPPASARCGRCGTPFHPKSPITEAAAGVPGPAAPPAPASPRGGSTQRVGRCSLCQGVFGPSDLFDLEGKSFCSACLTKAQETRKPEKEMTAADRKTDRAYLKEKVIADRLRAEGRTASSATAMWPKCQNHPNRPTKDKCRVCGKAICAMCARRRVDDIYCVDCYQRMESSSTGRQSGKFSGLSPAVMDTIKEVLFSPANFFSNLPKTGSLARPYLFAVVNFLPGSVILLLLARFVLGSNRALSFDSLDRDVLLPVLYGALLLAVLTPLAGWIPFHALARLFGGQASAGQGFRMFALASPFGLVALAPPFAGVPLAAVFAATTLIRAVSEVYSIGLPASFFVFLFSAAAGTAAAGAWIVFVVFPGILF